MSCLYAGKKVAISKPIQTGTLKDTELLRRLTGSKIPIFNTYSFTLGAAPIVSSKAENENIEKEKVISDIKKLEQEYDFVIVEGIGGIAVPIAEEKIGTGLNYYLVADLIKELNYPTIIVARQTLGTINHTVLTIQFAQEKGIDLLGFIISGYDEKENDLVVKTAPEVISNITDIKCLAKIPFIKEINKEINYESINNLAKELAILMPIPHH